MNTVLVTGAAGFIGFHVSKKLLSLGFKVVGVDNLNNYYSVTLKESRVKILNQELNFSFIKEDIANEKNMADIFKEFKPSIVINLAAQAGVRYSIENPKAYIDSNISGFLNIMNCCKDNKVEHLVYASSSSVYGNSTNSPFSTQSNISHPVSIYAATKASNELMAHVYSHQYSLPTTGLRFFTVYGPWGRPDMAPIKFAEAIRNGKPIDVYNHGEHWRDFTYIDDIVDGVISVMNTPPKKNEFSNNSPDRASAPYKIYNIGAKDPVHLMTFIELIEKEMGVKAVKNMLPMQPGDVETTHADISALVSDFNYQPKVKINDGVRLFIDWFKESKL